MDEDFKRLHDFINFDKYDEAKTFLQSVSNTFENELSDATVDIYILNIFDESFGFLSFIQKTVDKRVYRETIADAITECVGIIYSLVKYFPKKVEKYTPNIRTTCLKVILTSNSKAKEKKRSLELLQLMLEKTDYFPDGQASKQQLFTRLYRSYESATGDVLGLTIKTLGALLERYPDVTNDPHRLYKSIFMKLKNNINKATDSPVTECFSFLSAYLAVDTVDNIDDVYKCIKERMSVETHWKASLREGLYLLRKHVELFSEFIYKDAEFWCKTLNEWLNEMKGDNLKAAYYTLDEVQKCLSKSIATDTQVNRSTFMKFWQRFINEIFHVNQHGYKLRLAILGFGHFSAAARIFLPKTELNTAFYDFTNKIERTYLIDFNDKATDNLDYLPNYIQALSSIVEQLEDVTEYELGILRQATVLVIRLFPRLSHHHHAMVVTPIVIAYNHVRSSRGSMAKQYLMNTIREGVIHTCSHAIVNSDLEYYQDITTYRNYMPFWQNLIHKSPESYMVLLHTDSETSARIQSEIFDEFMAVLFYLMDKLNLSTRTTEDYSKFTDPKATLQAVKVSDFNIFVNAIDFYVDVLEKANKRLFKKWTLRFLNNVMVKSKKSPLVSGFYKLLAVGLRISNESNYFTEERLQEREDIRLCYDAVRNSIDNILMKIKLYKDDLKISCIRVILSTPILMVSDILMKIAPVMVSLFSLGRSNLQLTELGMDALEYWSKNINQKEFDPFLREVLPCLDSHLCSRAISEKFDTTTLKVKRTRQAMSRRKIIAITEGDLFKVQKRILTFMTGLSNDMCRSFVENNDAIGDTLYYSNNFHLKVDLAFNNVKVPLYLEKFVPRIIELSLYCSERKLRINSCEVLHAMVLVLLGRTKEMTDAPKKDLHGFLKSIIEALLKLGCDADLTVQKILRPLMLELMHWYSSKLMKQCSHTAIVVETVLDGITQTTDSAVRDFSCLCIREFIDWSIKQSTQSEMARDPINVQIILRKIKFFSSHSDPAKRLAAALIFNNIYTILREEGYIFGKYWIVLLNCFVTNLSLIDEYDEYDCLAQVHACLDHLQRGFVEKCHVFNGGDKDRSIPLNFGDGLLADVACWLLKQTGSPNRHCREKCFELFANIAPLCEKGNLGDFMRYYQSKQGDNWMRELYFPSNALRIDAEITVETLFKWMSDLQCLLDSHIFFQLHEIALNESNIPILQEAVGYFCAVIYGKDLQTLSSANYNFGFTPFDKENFNSLKSNITKKYVKFFLITGKPFEETHWEIFTRMVFENNSLLLEEIHAQEIDQFLDLIKPNMVDELVQAVQRYLRQNPLRDCSLTDIVPYKQRQILKGLLILKRSHLSHRIPLRDYTNFEGLIERMTSPDGVVINLESTTREYCSLKIDLYLLDGDVAALTNCLTKDNLVKTSQQREQIEFGRYFFDTFKPNIITYLTNNFDRFLETLIAKRTARLVYFIEEIVSYFSTNLKSFERTIYDRVIERILSHWLAFEEFYGADVDCRIKGLKLLEKISYLLNEDSQIPGQSVQGACDWMGDCLNLGKFDLLPYKKFEFLNCCIAGLPVFLRYEDEDFTMEILNRLMAIENKYFTNLPSEIRETATISINKAFQAAILAKSKYLFAFSSRILILVEPKDLNADQYCKIFMRNANIDLQVQLLNLVHTTDYTKYSPELHYKVIREILACLVRYASYEAFVQFYVENIPEILSAIRENATDELVYVKKSVGFILIRMLFSRIQIDQTVTEVDCPVTLSAYPGTDDPKKLIKDVIGITSQLLKSENALEYQILQDWDRICKCECYNALISVVCNMQDEPKWYNLLFKREMKGRNMLWRNIVDDLREYTFQVDFDEIPKKRQNLVAIRSVYREKSRHRGLGQSLRYIESQNILSSSLGEDIVRYDLSRTILRSQELESSLENDSNHVEMQVDIDADELNSHECMATLCGLFQHLHDENIYESSNSPVPDFVASIRKELEDPTTSRNVKLFLVKAIENKRDIFKPYANFLFAPIMQLIVDGITGSNINYFVTDLIVMLVSWAEGLENIETNQCASELACFLIKNVSSDRRDMMKYHIDLIKLFVEQWKREITVPKDYLLDQLKLLSKSKKVLPIIHISSIFLANDLPPWNDVKIFMKKLIEILSAKPIDVYRSAAEAIGTALRYVFNHGDGGIMKDFCDYLVKSLKKLDESRQLVCLQAMLKHYPEICDNFFTILIHRFSKYPGHQKGICLKIFLERINALHESLDFPTVNLEDLVNDDNDQLKIIGLEIIKLSLPVLSFPLSSKPRVKLTVKKEKLLKLLDRISKFVDSENNVCRSTAYDFFMALYEDDTFSADNDIRDKCKDVLLQGLVDHNSDIEEKLINFWGRILPVNTSEKFIFLLKDMYKAGTESYYLGYYVNFLLNELVLREEYQEAMFAYNLIDCTHTEYRIKDNWRERHSTLAPMFAQSYRSQSEDGDWGATMSTFDNEIRLRATADEMEFEPTQRQDALDLEKWNTIERPIEIPDEEKDPDEQIFKKPLPVKAWKKRFHKDETRTSRGFALRELEQSTKAERKRQDTIKQRQQEVNILRSYRKGDFPDITLSTADLLTPLKMLVKHDNQVAKLFYTILFTSITEKGKGDNENFVELVAEGVNVIFENSLTYDTNLMSALLDVALKHTDIRFSTDIIVKVASNSGLLSSGALLLEEYLTNGFEDVGSEGEPSQKRRRSDVSDDSEVECWLKLADLYKELEDWDLVRAVFLHKLNCDETVMRAIDAESRGLWRDAQELYQHVITSHPPMEQRSFYYESYYKCFAELSDWEHLSESIKVTVSENDYWNELWDDGWNQQKLLPWFMIGELRNSLVSEQTRNTFISQVNEALSNTNKLVYMKQHFSEEIAFLYLQTGNFDKVKYFVLNNIELFLGSWASLSPLLTSLKMKKLLKIQNSLEIYNFVNRFNNFTQSNRNSVINDMCKEWLKVYDENLSSIVSSETKTVYRGRCLAILQDKFDSEVVRKNLERAKFQLEMNLVKTALDVRNFHVAKKYVQNNSEYGSSDSRDGIKYHVAYSRLLHLKATNLGSPENRLEFLVNAWKPLSDCLNGPTIRNSTDLFLSTNIYAYELMQDLRDTLSSDNLTADNQVLAATIWPVTGKQPPYTSEMIGDFSFKFLRDALDRVEVEAKDENNLKAIADAHYKLASSISSDAGRKKELIVHVLKAMSYGSTEARQFFPCLLDIEDLGSIYKDTFSDEAEKLPEWMFIQWIPQLLANLDTLNIAAIFPIVEKIAKTYPQSIMYAYRLSKQKYDFESKSKIKNYGEQAIKRLDELLSDPLVDKFLEALSCVSLWTNIVDYHWKQLVKACGMSADHFSRKLNELRSLCEEEVPDSRSRTSLKGAVFREIVSRIREHLLPLGREVFNAKTILQKLAKIKNIISNSDRRSGPSANERALKLSHYSPWLENFSDNVTNLSLEIPGQYDGNRKPLLQYHVKICGFSSELSRFKSLRSPLKLTIIGSDAKEYPFLVKFGEDLRQDQRLEQIFGLMNNIFNNDSICREKRLNIRTYQVIPLTGTLGLIECVPNAVTYKELLMNTVPEYRKDHEKIADDFHKQYVGKSTALACLMTQTPQSAIPKFRIAVNKLPSDAFRRALWKLSIDTESFVALRNKFASSHAVNCIANWILGIGDRNLSNSMVCLKNGQTMDIDFGYAFGTGVQIIQIAEVVPIRLTPHLVELTRPLKEHGLLEETMIHVLRALRNNSKPLLSTMSVFIKEPSLEWIDFQLRENTPGGYRWCPEKKLDHVRRKLEGASSVEIMVEELGDRPGDERHNDKYIEYVKGNERDNVRAKLSGKLSVEQQVACLIDHATDYNLLSRLFGGFEAWV